MKHLNRSIFASLFLSLSLEGVKAAVFILLGLAIPLSGRGQAAWVSGTGTLTTNSSTSIVGIGNSTNQVPVIFYGWLSLKSDIQFDQAVGGGSIHGGFKSGSNGMAALQIVGTEVVSGIAPAGDVSLFGGNSLTGSPGAIKVNGGINTSGTVGHVVMQTQHSSGNGNNVGIGINNPPLKLTVASKIGVLSSGSIFDPGYSSRYSILGDERDWGLLPNGYRKTGTRSQWDYVSTTLGVSNRLNESDDAIKDGLIEWADDEFQDLYPKRQTLDAAHLKPKFRFVFRNALGPNPSDPDQGRTEVMTLNSKGQVGIATDRPYGKLDVAHVAPTKADIGEEVNDEIGLGIFSFMKNPMINIYLPKNAYRETVAVQGTNITNFANSPQSVQGFNSVVLGLQGTTGPGPGDFNQTPEQVNIGVRGSAYNAKWCYGVYGTTNGNNLGNASNSTFADGKWGVFSDGDFGTSGGGYTASDEKLKEKITPLTKSSDLLSALSPKTYFFKNAPELLGVNTDKTRKQYGLLAQEVEKILPELVKQHDQFPKKSPDGKSEYPAVSYKMVNYVGIIPILIAGFQEQQNTINNLRGTLDSLITLLHVDNKTSDVALSNKVINQPTVSVNLFPNPNHGVFKLKVNSNGSHQNLFLYFTNLAGSIVLKQQVVLNEEMEIDLKNQASGIYQYTLFSETTEVASSKFVIE